MNTQELFQTAMDTVKRTESSVMHHINPRLLHAFLGLGDESGELIKQAKDQIYYDKQFTYNERIEELGDHFWYFTLAILALADQYDLKSPERIFQDIVLANAAKLRARYPEKYSDTQAIERNIVAEYQAIQEVTCRT